jgi:DNA gyrase subunit A
MGVKFVTPKSGDTVAVVARSVEAKVAEEEGNGDAEAPEGETTAPAEESPVVGDGATIEGQEAVEASTDTPDETTEE